MPTLHRPDASIAFDTAGQSGPRVLLVQGTGVLGAGWRPQIEGLRADHQLVSFDNRGIGESTDTADTLTIERMGADCLALMDHLGWESAHLVGHSMGGMIVQAAALLAPQRMLSLSLLSTARCGRDVLALPLRALWPSLNMQVGGDARRWRYFTALAFPPAFRREVGTARAVELLQSAFVRDFVRMPSSVRRQIGALWKHHSVDLRPLRSIPALIVTGDHDLTVNTRFSDELAAKLPGSRLERFMDAAHALPLQHPAAVTRLLRERIADV